MAYERAPQMQPPLHDQVRPSLDLLPHDLGEQVGLGEVLGPDDDSVPPSAAAHRTEQSEEQPPAYLCHTSLRSASPSAPSAASAISAAGIAPARINVSSTTATPRKM